MTTKTYKQVELTQYSTVEQGDIIKQMITHIPSKFAVLHKELYVEDQPNVWTVTWVSKFEIDTLPDVNYEIRKHKRNTGDSLPK